MHQLRPLLVADPKRGAAFLAIVPIRRALPAIDGCVPHAERTLAFNFKRVRYPHDIDGITTATRALATDRTVAALVRVGRVAVDRKRDRPATAGAFEPHRHRNPPREAVS